MVHEYSDPGCRRRRDLNLSGFLLRSAVNGPGTRAVVWVQGCPIRCSGCFNKATWSFSPAHIVPVDELASGILAANDIDGVTFSGGEPFAQADALADVAEQVREKGLTVITYSGYTYENLIARNDPAVNRLLAATDLLIAGPYCEDRASTRPFIGSENQQVIDLTGRIPLTTTEPGGGGRIEFTIAADGSVTTTGFPEPGLVEKIAARCQGDA